MWRFGTFVDQWLLPGRSIRVGSKRRPPRRPPIGKRPTLEAVEERILLSAADVAMIRATPLEVRQLGRSSVQITEVRGIELGNRRAELMATLTSNGQPVVGQTVAFRLGLRLLGRARTDSDGVATLTNVRFSRLEFKNYQARTVVVFRGNDNLKPVVRRGPLTIGQSPSTLAGVTGSGVYGGTATFSASLSSNGAAISAKAVSFVLDGRTLGTATTDAMGVATLSGVGLDGLGAGTYGIAARFAGDADSPQAIAPGSLTIAKAAASITLGDLSQTYGGTGQATPTTSPAGLPISLAYTDANGHAVAQPKRAGTYGVAATIVDGNHSGAAVGTLVISPASLSVSGIDASSKTYDGSTATTIDAGPAVLVGVVAGDSVAIDASHAAANFDAAGVGANRPVAISGLALTGPDASNYVLSNAATTALADITPKALTISGITAIDKVYDGTTNAEIDASGASLVGAVAGDAVALDAQDAVGSFSSKSAGVNKSVAIDGLSLAGSDAGNYTLGSSTATATISPKALAVAGITARDKVYDGTTTATLDTTGASLTGLVAGDSVGLDASASVGSFATRNAGASATVTIDGLVLNGADAGNYVPVSTATTTATISPRALTLSGVTAIGKVYDGTTDATLDTQGASLSGVVAGDDATLDTASAIASFADRNVGASKPVSSTGLTLAGADAANYTLAAPTITGTISPRALSVSGHSASDKVYDGTTDASFTLSPALALNGAILGDDVTLHAGAVTASFGTRSAGIGKTVTFDGLSLTGVDSGNYVLLPVTALADISKATLAVTNVSALNKDYDGTTTASIDASGAGLSGVVAGDAVAVDGAGVTGAFDSSAAESFSRTVTTAGFSLVGPDADNYDLVQPVVYAYINRKALTVSGITASDKVYDGTTAATIDDSGAALVGVVAGDDVTIDDSAAAAEFGDKNVGDGKAITITGLALSGADIGNYTITAPMLTADIVPKALGLTGVTAYPKVYDGTTGASYYTTMPSLTGVVGGDSVILTSLGAASFADKNVGTGKPITFADPGIVGSDAGNYTFDPTITGNITPAPINVSGITASHKVYDGTTVASIDIGGAFFTGVIGGDDVTIDDSAATGRFDDKGVGTGKAVSIDGLTKSGADAGNYSFQFSAAITADITPKSVHALGFTATNRAYDGTTGVVIGAGPISLEPGDLVAGDDVAFDASTAAFAAGVMADANASTGKTVTISGLGLTGADAANYAIVASTTVDIARATISLSGVTASKVYDGTIEATLDMTGASILGVIGSDDVTLDASMASGAFADKNVGVGKAITLDGFSLSGADAGNYTLALAPITGDIASRVLHIEGFTATDRT